MTNLLITALAILTPLCDGSLGWAIVTLSLLVRLGLLPFTLRLVRRSGANQHLAARMRSEIDELRARHRQDPGRMYREIANVQSKNDYKPVDLKTLAIGFIQWPIFAGVYGAIKTTLGAGTRLLWIKNLAAPDFLLTLLVLALSLASALWMPAPSQGGRSLMPVLQLGFTLLMIWKLATGLGLYSVASSGVSLVQSVWLRLSVAPIDTAAC